VASPDNCVVAGLNQISRATGKSAAAATRGANEGKSTSHPRAAIRSNSTGRPLAGPSDGDDSPIEPGTARIDSPPKR
jgi:hypothetical protein